MNRKFLITLTLGIFFCGILITSCKKDNNENNESDYFNHEGHSYQIVKTNKTWKDAAADAVALGGYLTEIGNKAEQDAIYQAIKNSGIGSTYTQVADV